MVEPCYSRRHDTCGKFAPPRVGSGSRSLCIELPTEDGCSFASSDFVPHFSVNNEPCAADSGRKGQLLIAVAMSRRDVRWTNFE